MVPKRVLVLVVGAVTALLTVGSLAVAADPAAADRGAEFARDTVTPKVVLQAGAAGSDTRAIAGVPVVVQRGITETVAQIMARERLMPAALLASTRETDEDLEEEPALKEDPNLPLPLSHRPPIPAVFSAAIVGAPNLPQTVGTSFKGVGRSESNFIPPDSMGDVGPTQILIHVNGRIKVFNKTGVLGPLNASASAFWASVTTQINDPQVRYDRLSGRWFVLAISLEAVNNKIVLAVSSGPTITGTSSFTFYQFNIGTPAPADASYYCLDPGFGIDANALYVGCNMYGASPHGSAFVIRKSSVTSGGPIVVTGFSDIDSVNSAGPYTLRGVDNDDPSWTEGYLIGTDFTWLDRINILRISDPGGIPTLSPTITLFVWNTTLLDQPALGSPLSLFPIDVRLFAASIHKNKLTGETSLWTAQSVETDTTCTPGSNQNGLRLGAKWYEIGSLTTSPTITQFGTLCTTATGSATSNTQRGFLFPTVVETGQGHMALAASYASAAEFVGVAAAGRLRTDPASGTRVPETIVQPGLDVYSAPTGGRNRWGDYSFTDVDPNDDQTVWTFQEYADTPSNTWSVRAIQLKAPPPPDLVSSSNDVCAGVAAAPVTINGSDSCAAPTCADGLCTGGGSCPEFFDPGPDTGGPGYANHLTAIVLGGVTVNSASIVLPANPATQRVLQVALSLNTTGAVPGTKSVRIVNPDGQVKLASIISVIANRVPVANAGGPYSTCQGSSVAPDGTGSTDPDAICGDSVVSYEWDLNNDAVFDVTGPTPTVTSAQLSALGLGVGPHAINLRVTDTHGATNTGSGSLAILGDGSACSDGNACTQVDSCQSGACTGANPVICDDTNPCTTDTCNPGTGACSLTPITAPPEAQNVGVASDKVTYTWAPTIDATRYDVIRGALASLPVGPGGDDEVCFDDLGLATLVDATTPAPDTGFWYLSRGENACFTGTYGAQSDTTPRESTTCP
jgi:hypothetical protein